MHSRGSSGCVLACTAVVWAAMAVETAGASAVSSISVGPRQQAALCLHPRNDVAENMNECCLA